MHFTDDSLLDPVALLITVGGALAVTRATFSREAILGAWSRLQEALGGGSTEEVEAERVVATFKRLARIQRVEGARALDRAAEQESDPFLRQAVQEFLSVQWRAGALQGRQEQEAFFVRADRATMTQDDIDNRRLIVEIGVAPVKPAEFVMFRIARTTADSKR